MRTVVDVRAALATALGSISGLTALAKWPGVLNPPSAIVQRRRGPLVTEFDGGMTTWLEVRLYLPSSDMGSAADALDLYLSHDGPASVRAALSADTTLGGIVRCVLLEDPPEEEGLVEYPPGSGVEFLSAVVPVTVVHE